MSNIRSLALGMVYTSGIPRTFLFSAFSMLQLADIFDRDLLVREMVNLFLPF